MTRIRLQYVHAFRDRHGKVRYYFRRPGFKQIPLPSLPGSAEFMAAYEAALAGMTVPRHEIGASRTKPGTVNAVIVAYYQALVFRALAPGTQHMRRAILERFRSEHGDKRIATLPREFIVRMLSRKAPAAARNWLKTLRGLLAFAVAEGFRSDDPTQSIKLPPLKSDGIHAWTEDEIAQFEERHPVGTKARLALALLLDTAQRRGDVILMGRQHIHSGAIHVRQNKTGEHLIIPIYPSLQAVLDKTPCEHMTFLTTDFGKPFTAAGFGNWFRDRCNEAGLPKRCSAHGLRKAAARRLAEEGATTHHIASMTGHRSLSEVQRYTRSADQARLAREAVELRKRRSSKSRTPMTGTRTSIGKPQA
ncbi:MAG: tyrosine-type recombinase/integrase [Steroidobacteraceae bacterium]|jgi:integrase